MPRHELESPMSEPDIGDLAPEVPVITVIEPAPADEQDAQDDPQEDS